MEHDPHKNLGGLHDPLPVLFPVSGMPPTARGHMDIAEVQVDQGLIEYVPFPDALKGKYQSFTQADVSLLRATGYSAPFASVQQGVASYVEWLSMPD